VKPDATTCESRDILSSRWRVFILYWLPAIAIVVAGAPAISNGAVVWTVALATMGTACMVNALRCGRVHCYLTGPFFLLMAWQRPLNHSFRFAGYPPTIDKHDATYL